MSLYVFGVSPGWHRSWVGVGGVYMRVAVALPFMYVCLPPYVCVMEKKDREEEQNKL